MKSDKCRINQFAINCSEQTSRSLRIEKQVLIFGRNAVGETYAVANERAIIFQAAGEMSIARSFESAGEIFERGVIDFERDRSGAARWITQRHFARVTQKAETRDVGDSVNDAVVFRNTPTANHVGNGAVFEPCD